MEPQKNYKFLFILIGIVFVLTALLYVGYRWYTSSPYRVVNVVDPAAKLPKLSPTPVDSPAITKSNTNYVMQLKNGVLKSSELTNMFEGKITNLITGKPGTVKYSQFGQTVSYDASVSIEGAGKQSNTFYYSGADLAVLKVFAAGSETTKVQITLADLGIGDTVEIRETVNLLKFPGQNRTSIVIFKK